MGNNKNLAQRKKGRMEMSEVCKCCAAVLYEITDSKVPGTWYMVPLNEISDTVRTANYICKKDN